LCHCVFAWEGDDSGKPIGFATDKPGDLPLSLFGTAEGCVTK